MEIIMENQADGEFCLEELDGCSGIRICCRKVEGNFCGGEKTSGCWRTAGTEGNFCGGEKTDAGTEDALTGVATGGVLGGSASGRTEKRAASFMCADP